MESNMNTKILGLGSILVAIMFAGCGGGDGGTSSPPRSPIDSEHRVSVGESHSLALDANGNVWAWGSNYAGQLGNRTTEPSTRPTQVLLRNGATAVSAGSDMSLALRADGTVWSWGKNTLIYSDGASDANILPVLCAPGYPLTSNVTAPIQIAGLDQVIQISAGSLYAMALRSDGTVWSWGSNSNGQLGTGATADHVCLPTQITGLSGVKAIAAGGGYALALKTDGTVWGWGINSAGVLGNGTLISSNVPVQVSGLSDIVSIAVSDHSVALDSKGTVWGWGYNLSGQVGNDSANENCGVFTFYNLPCVKSPVKVNGLPAVKRVVAAVGSTYAIDQNNAVWGWGTSNSLGTPQSTATCSMAHVSWPCIRTPLTLSHLVDFTSIVTGAIGNHVLAVKADGSLWSWGSNLNGQLGSGNTTWSRTPVQVLEPSGWGGFNLGTEY